MKSKLRTRSAKRKLLFCLCLCLAAHAIVLGLPRRRAATRGLFPVSKEGKWGFIDGGGRVRIPLRFDSAASFSEGLAPVLRFEPGGARTGYIDKTGKVVWEPSR